MLTVAPWNLENLFQPDAGADPAAKQAYKGKLDAMIEQIAPPRRARTAP